MVLWYYVAGYKGSQGFGWKNPPPETYFESDFRSFRGFGGKTLLQRPTLKVILGVLVGKFSSCVYPAH